jgi:large subunit ribosomal protein L3
VSDERTKGAAEAEAEIEAQASEEAAGESIEAEREADAEAPDEASAGVEAEAEAVEDAVSDEAAEASEDEETSPADPESGPLSAPGILGRKVGMTQVFSSEGDRVPVTVIEAGPCVVVQVKTRERDGYDALQMGFGSVRPKRVSKPRAGHFLAHGVEPTRLLREVRLDEPLPDAAPGRLVTCEGFEAGELVDVTGVSKGRGFTGVMKRHGFKGSPASHGTHEHFRHGGSIGAAAAPSRVFKGTRMPGQMGNARVTVQNLELVRVVPEQNLLMIRGAVPGPSGGFVMVRKSLKAGQRAKSAV